MEKTDTEIKAEKLITSMDKSILKSLNFYNKEGMNMLPISESLMFFIWQCAKRCSTSEAEAKRSVLILLDALIDFDTGICSQCGEPLKEGEDEKST